MGNEKINAWIRREAGRPGEPVAAVPAEPQPAPPPPGNAGAGTQHPPRRESTNERMNRFLRRRAFNVEILGGDL
jgi:hypothetical protein